jgi:hypothetical protein
MRVCDAASHRARQCSVVHHAAPAAASHTHQAGRCGMEHAMSAVAPPGGCVDCVSCITSSASDMPSAFASHCTCSRRQRVQRHTMSRQQARQRRLSLPQTQGTAAGTRAVCCRQLHGPTLSRARRTHTPTTADSTWPTACSCKHQQQQQRMRARQHTPTRCRLHWHHHHHQHATRATAARAITHA